MKVLRSHIRRVHISVTFLFFDTAIKFPVPEKMSPGNDSGIVEMDMPLRPPVPQFERPATAAARPQTSMGRPGTAAARPAPPKLKKKVIATIEETQMVKTPTMFTKKLFSAG